MSTSAPKSKTIYVLAPVLLDTKSFLLLRKNIHDVLSKSQNASHLTVQFVIVDDSGDLDPEISLLHQLKDVRVISPPFNLGHQRAIVHGLRKIASLLGENDVVVTLDSDGEDKPEDLPRLLHDFLDEKNPSKIVLAWRTKRQESLLFKLMYVCFKLFFKVLTGLVIKTGNYAVLPGTLVKKIIFHPRFDLCYSSSLTSLNIPIEYIPCERGHRYFGQSRMNFLSLFMHGLRMMIPFIDRITTRTIIALTILLASSSTTLAIWITLNLFHYFSIPYWVAPVSGGMMTLSLVGLLGMGIIFIQFSQSTGYSLKNLERQPIDHDDANKMA